MENASQSAPQQQKSMVMKSKCGEDFRKKLLLQCPTHDELLQRMMRLYKLNYSPAMQMKYLDAGEQDIWESMNFTHTTF